MRGRRDQNGVGRDVAVQLVAGVGVGQGIGQLGSETDGAANLERLSGDERAQRDALDPLDGEEDRSGLFAHVIQAGNVRMRQAAQPTDRVDEMPLCRRRSARGPVAPP